MSLTGAARLIADRMWRSPEDRALFEEECHVTTIPPMHTEAYERALNFGHVADYHHRFLLWAHARIRVSAGEASS